MFSPRRSSKTSKSAKSATPLDRKQQALHEKEEQLRQATEQLRRLIDDAPRRREEQTRRRREQLASDTRLSRTALVDKRYDVFATANPSFGKRRLRSEKRDGKFLFLVLCFVLAGVLIWVTKLVMTHL